ncbi:uncharacterized protein [Rutidosis leptorrhynchoides]|uniref:uncharacterized protein n=1 Tax=Rutidosis leptorrhynchoides TaxID=125765 RepID=UPI003A99130A
MVSQRGIEANPDKIRAIINMLLRSYKEQKQEFLKKYDVQQGFTSIAHPSANGQVEVTNRSIVDGLKKKLKDLPKKQWVDELPKVLWAYRTTCKVPTGETPYKLTYGTDTIVPVDVGLRSYRIKHYNPSLNEEGLLLNLDLIDEVRDNAAIKIAEQKLLTVKFYNNHIHGRAFKVGDFVLRKMEASKPLEAVEKLSLN